jgi:hypothetical protein
LNQLGFDMNITYYCITGLAAFFLVGGTTAAVADTTDNDRFHLALTPQASPKGQPFNLQDVKLLDGFFLDGQKVSASIFSLWSRIGSWLSFAVMQAWSPRPSITRLGINVNSRAFLWSLFERLRSGLRLDRES